MFCRPHVTSPRKLVEVASKKFFKTNYIMLFEISRLRLMVDKLIDLSTYAKDKG